MNELQRRWRDLVERRLPEAARLDARNWPIRLDHCFARVLLDNACGRLWREAISPPAWRNADEPTLARAVALGEAVLAGRDDLHALNARSLALRRREEPPDRFSVDGMNVQVGRRSPG